MDNSPAVAFMKDDEGATSMSTSRSKKVFGQKLSFLKGRTSFDWLPPISAADTHDDDLKVLESGRRGSVSRVCLLATENCVIGWYSSFHDRLRRTTVHLGRRR